MIAKRTWVFGTLAVLVAVFVAAAYLYRSNVKHANQAKVRAHQERLVRPGSPSLGPADAPVTIVEFLDPECEACAAFYPVVKDILRRYPDQVRLVVRYFPLHGNSKYAANLLEMMRSRGKFWETLEVFFARQSDWASHHDPKPELLKGYVVELGVAPEQIEQAVGDPVYEGVVLRDEADAMALGLRGTPTFFVNGELMEELSPQAMDRMIRRHLAK